MVPRTVRIGIRAIALPLAIAILAAACDSTVPPTPTASVAPVSVAPPTLTASPSVTTATATPTASPTLAPAPTPTASPSPSPSPSEPASEPQLVGPAPCPGRAADASTGTAEADTSTNWSGYTATSSHAIFTCVEATWVQPKIHCSGTSSRAVSVWVGIGGFDQEGLEQIGTEADCRHGTAVASMWHESLPSQRAEVGLDVAVAPGDTVRARVRSLGKNVYELSIVNVTDGTTATVRDTNRRLSATSVEWIVEAPTGGCLTRCRILPMPNFGKLRFTGTWLTASGVRRALNGSGFVHVNDRMVTADGSATRSAVTSTKADGTSFVVTWRRS